MKILIFGAGVIGTTYAWQLSEAGFDVSLFVRKQKMVRFSHSGISISCTDMRGKKKAYTTSVFRPKTIDSLDASKGFDLIIVSVKTYQLDDVVPFLAKNAGKASILFLGNIWGGFDLIQKNLPANSYLFGFPAMAGGGKTDGGIQTTLFKNGNTMLGEPDGKVSQRLKNITEIMGKSGMQPKISGHIIGWLKAHYIWPAATFGAICKAGGVKAFSSNNKLIKQSAIAIREGFRVCKKQQVNPWQLFPYTLFYLPLAMVVPILKRSYNPEMQEVIEGNIRHGFDEMKKQYYDVLNDGNRLAVDMPYWKSFEKHVIAAEKKRL